VIPNLTWCFVGSGGHRSGYFKVRGNGDADEIEDLALTLVGSASIGTVALVPAKRT
jgi:hypothetical protein